MQSSYSAYYYAKHVDKCPRDDTREAACKDSQCAYFYARDVDQKPRKDTREAACKDPYCAYEYARDIDQNFHEDTWEAVKNTDRAEMYKKIFNVFIKDKII